jgi:hypothetical protein
MMQETKHQLRISGLMAILASAWVAQSAGGQGERLTVEVGECVDLPTPEQRLACFEAQVDAARGAPAATAPAATSAAPAPAASTAPATTSAGPAAAPATNAAAPATTTVEVPATTSTAPAEFGFRERLEAREDAPPPPEVRAKVAELRETVPNAFLITLDNGQVWRQTRPDPYLSLKVGQDVRIYFSRWRAYRLESPQMRGFLQVERVR